MLKALNTKLQIPGEKKPKKGKFNGYGTLTFSDLGHDNSAKLYGVRNGKCLRISNRDLKSISGYFENDVLMVGRICFYRKILVSECLFL